MTHETHDLRFRLPICFVGSYNIFTRILISLGQLVSRESTVPFKTVELSINYTGLG